jgi:tRNA A37 methylthiotransferase MiaB
MEADLIVLVSCGYLQRKERESIEILRGHQMNKKAKILDIGCLSKIIHLGGFSNVTFLPPTELHRIGEVLNIDQDFESFEDPQTIQRDKLNKRPFDTTRTDENICHIVICSGCSGKCTYCVDWKSIGSVKSRPKERILSEMVQQWVIK